MSMIATAAMTTLPVCALQQSSERQQQENAESYERNCTP
jgi:hypothetical protein